MTFEEAKKTLLARQDFVTFVKIEMLSVRYDILFLHACRRFDYDPFLAFLRFAELDYTIDLAYDSWIFWPSGLK